MGEQILNAFGDRLTTAIVVSAVLALAIVAIVALAWWWGRRWAGSRANAWSTGRIRVGGRMTHPGVNQATGDTGPEPAGVGPEPVDIGPEPAQNASAPDGEQWGSRLIRDTALRAAALRDTWDRSYSAARMRAGDTATERNVPAHAGSDTDRLTEIVAEQRRTNALLSEVLAELRDRR